MKAISILATLAAAGCERNLLAGLADAPAIDANGCPTPVQPLAAGKYLLYLNTEGVTLHKGATGMSDSRTNTSDLIVNDGTIVPPFLPSSSDRTTFIQQIVDIAQNALAQYSLDITTSRPQSGDYFMLVLGGDGQSIINCATCYGLVDFNCVPLSHEELMLGFDFGSDAPDHTATFYANTLLHDIGATEGLAATVDSNDCECTFGAPCARTREGPLCTYGSNEQVDQTQTAESGRCGRTTQDEPALLAAGLGCR